MCVIIYLLQECDKMSLESVYCDAEEDMETTEYEEVEVSIIWTRYYKFNF